MQTISRKQILFLILNLVLAIGAGISNEFFQAYCQPVTWAKITIALFLLAFFAWPFIPQEKKILRNIALFLQGIGFCICLYCILFGVELMFYSLLMLIYAIGIFGFAPLLFLVQIIIRISKEKNKTGWISFLAGILLILSFGFYFSEQYAAIGKTIRQIPASERSPKKIAESLPRNYMAERFAGMHFRYHTAYCPYDGWRPPLHDPFLVFSRWIHPETEMHWYVFPLEKREALYRLMYPGENAFADCYCAGMNNDARTYPKNQR